VAARSVVRLTHGAVLAPRRRMYSARMSVFPVRHQVTVDEFERMVEADVFAPDERLELIDGEIIDMSPIGSPHQACIDRLTRWFAPLTASERAVLRVQGVIRVSERSQPQPDVALLRPRDDMYEKAHPNPEDVLLLVEVADSSIRHDRWIKLPLYATAGVPEAWLVDLNWGVVDIATDPSPHGYARVVQARSSDTIAPTAFPDITIPVARLLGQSPSTPA
jgi:MEMO1 family protein